MEAIEESICEMKIDEACDAGFEERMKFAGECLENELKILRRGGLPTEKPLGDADRSYDNIVEYSLKECGDDSLVELYVEDFWREFLEGEIYERIHEDFQYPLVRYLETFHAKQRVEFLLVWMWIRFRSFSMQPFSDEMKENWEPLMKLLKD